MPHIFHHLNVFLPTQCVAFSFIHNSIVLQARHGGARGGDQWQSFVVQSHGLQDLLDLEGQLRSTEVLKSSDQLLPGPFKVFHGLGVTRTDIAMVLQSHARCGQQDCCLKIVTLQNKSSLDWRIYSSAWKMWHANKVLSLSLTQTYLVAFEHFKNPFNKKKEETYKSEGPV